MIAPIKPRRRLFWKYALLMAALVSAALIANGAVELYFSYRENRAALIGLQREKARAAAVEIANFVREIEGQIGWTTYPVFGTESGVLEQRRIDFIRVLRNTPPITELQYLDAAGREQMRVSRLAMDVIGSNKDLAAEPRFKDARAKRVYRSAVYFHKESEPYLTLAVAGSGRGGGVTVAEVNLKLIWDVVSRIQVGKGGRAYVVDQEGRLIAHPDISHVLRKTDMSQAPQVLGARAGAGAPAEGLIVKDLEGREVLSTHAAIPTLNWIVFAEVPVGEALAPLYESATRTAILLFAGVLLAVLVGLFFARRMASPIRELRVGAEKIGAGDLSHRIAIKSGDELQALGQEFNEMAGRLRESYATLEQKVETRTQELSESLERQTATSEVLGVISRSTSQLQPVLDAIVDTAARLCQAHYASIMKLDHRKYHLVATNHADAEHVEFLRRNPITPGRGSVAGRVALEGRAIHLPDAAADPEFTYAKGTRTILGVPLMREGAPIGVITLVRTVVQPFTDKQIELVSTFADQAVIAIENVRLFDEVQARTRELSKALEQQTATSEVLSVISRSKFEIQPVLDTIVETAGHLCGAEQGSIMKLVDGKYQLAAAYRMDPAVVEWMSHERFEADRGTAYGRAVLERRTIHIHDVLSDPEFTWHKAQQAEKFRTVLGVPLLRDGEPIGSIALRRTTVEPFTDKQIELVTTFADQAVIAIENVRLFDEVQARTKELSESLERQTATSEVLGVISRSTSQLQPVFDTIVDTAARLCQAESAHIYQLIDGKYHLAAACRLGEDVVEFLKRHPHSPGRGTIVGRTTLEKRLVHVHDVSADPQYTFKEALRVLRLRTVLGVPLLRDGEPIGVISLNRTEVKPFTDKQIELVTTFADQAVIAIENVRLFDEVQARTRALTEALEQLRGLIDVSRTVNSTLDLTTVLPAILENACKLADAGGGAIYVYDAETELLRLESTHGMSDELVAAIKKARIGRGQALVGRAIAERGPVQAPDLAAQPAEPLRDALLAAGIRAVLVVPLLREQEIVGALVVRRRRTGAFDERTIGVLDAFAQQSALAIVNARLFHEIDEKGRALEIASQHKSQFLANMSHELRTPLNAILGYTELIRDSVYGEISPRVRGVLERVEHNGRHLLGLINDVLDISKIEAGRLVLSMNDYALGDVIASVVVATESLAAEKGLALKTAVADSLPYGNGDERRLAQVLLNLVGNAIKFTERGEVRIEARAEGKRFEIAVIDTGPGIPRDQHEQIFEQFHQVDTSSTRTKGGTGLGLAISKQLVVLHGGRIWVESELGKGSTFRISLPVAAERQKEAA